MPGEVIAVDIDDVLFPCSFRLVDAYAERYGVSFDYPALMINGTIKGTLEILAEKLQIPDDQIIDHVEDILAASDFHDIGPHDGACEVLEAMAEDHVLHAVSSRPAVIREQTGVWLAAHFPEIFESVHVLGGRWGQGLTTDKLATFGELGVTHVIDDLPGHTFRASEIGARAILFGDYPWNPVEEMPEHVTQCGDWFAVREYFDAAG